MSIPSSLTGNNLRSKYSANSIYTIYIISVFARRCMRVTKLTIYKTNLKQVLFYACPAWYTFWADKDKTELERLWKAATKIIFTDTEFNEERLSLLNLTPVNDFLFSAAKKYFSKISENSSHPLLSRKRFNTFKTSSRKPVQYRTEICRTEKRKKSFFQFFMRHFNCFIFMCST